MKAKLNKQAKIRNVIQLLFLIFSYMRKAVLAKRIEKMNTFYYKDTKN
jgi:hypothetical protein